MLAQLSSTVDDQTIVGLYLIYALISITLVLYLARLLQRSGLAFLVDAFDDEELARSINSLLAVGFYLVNLGYAALLFRLSPDAGSLTETINQFTSRIGILLLSLGGAHLTTMFILWRIRTNREQAAQPLFAPTPAPYAPHPTATPAPAPAPMPTPSMPAPGSTTAAYPPVPRPTVPPQS
ncbi:MAG: hypothetical protein AAF467_21665 [Actinomycetota bacterium]